MKQIILFLAFVLILAAILAIAPVKAQSPVLVYVDADQAFVYPENGQVYLVLASGRYAVEGETLKSGCYHLTGNGHDQKGGRATWVWQDCGGGQ